jgi:hypothetical protein
MEEKIILGIISIVTALSPIFFNYVFKRLETKNDKTLRSRILEEAQKRFDFLDKYYQVQTGFLEGDKLAALKNELSQEAVLIKNGVSLSYKEPEIREPGHLSAFQRIFLTFKPITVWGWIFMLICYIDSIFIFFALIGYSLDPKTNEFSGEAFIMSLKDSDALTGILVFVAFLLLFRWLAVRSHDAAIRKRLKAQATEE